MLYPNLVGDIRNARDVLVLSRQMAAMYRHEVSTPLQAILGAVALLRARAGDTNELLDAIDRNVREIVDILTEQPLRGAVLSAEVCALSATAASAIDDAAVRGSTCRLTFRHETRDGEPPVRCPPATLRRVFANLFRNAAQARPDAHVCVRYSWCAEHLACVVEDDGPGFPEDVLLRVTAPGDFGEHLGLMLVTAEVEAQGGSVTLGNADGAGARVTVRLPRAEGASETQEVDAQPGRLSPESVTG